MIPCFLQWITRITLDGCQYILWICAVDLQEKALNVYNEFLRGNHTVGRSMSQSFNQVWADMALEQSINLESKTEGGIPVICITQRPSTSPEMVFDSPQGNSNHNCYLKNDRIG